MIPAREYSSKAIIATPVHRAQAEWVGALVDAEYARATTHCQTCGGRGGFHDPACERAEPVEAAA